MSNKKQLQQHNADLATALGDIDGLPMAEDVKHGKCVWERTTYTGTIWENPTIRFSFENSYHDMRITSDDIDLSMIDGSFFVGMILNFTEISTGGTYTLEFTSYDNESGIITIGGNFASGRTAVFENGVIKANSTICSSSCSYSNSYKFSGKKYSADYSETDNRYVVSDIINKYPEDGELDGYWYRKVNTYEQKIEIGSVTTTSNSKQMLIPTRVNEIERMYMFRRRDDISGQGVVNINYIKDVINISDASRGTTYRYAHKTKLSVLNDALTIELPDYTYGFYPETYDFIITGK